MAEQRPGAPASGGPEVDAESDLHADVGSYAVGALDPPEQAEFRAHLDSCSSCQQEVTEFAEATAELTRLVDTMPPTTLRRDTLAAISKVRPLPPLPPVPAGTPSSPAPPHDVAPLDDHPSVMPWSLSLGAPPSLGAAAVPPAAAPVGPRRRTTTAIGLALVAAVCAVLLFLGGWWLGASGQRAPQSPRIGQSDLLAAPDARLLPSTIAGVNVTVLVSEQQDAAMLIASNLPAPPENQVYQLWIFSGEQAASAGLIRNGGSVEATFAGSLSSADKLVVSLEPAPDGSSTPGTPLVTVRF